MSERETWDAERAYERLKSAIVELQAKENPTNCFALCTKKQLRVSLCANGSMPSDLFEQALEQLEAHEGVVVGSHYLSYPADLQMLNDAREFVTSQETIDKQFIASSNRVQQQHELESC